MFNIIQFTRCLQTLLREKEMKAQTEDALRKSNEEKEELQKAETTEETTDAISEISLAERGGEVRCIY